MLTEMVTNDGTRTRGILSDADKTYLKNPEEYAANHSRPAVLDRRRAIRERTTRAIHDFGVLAVEMNEEARREIFPASRQGEEWGDLYDGLVEMVAFAHLGLSSESGLEQLIEDGIRRAELRRGAVDDGLQVRVDCELDITHSPGIRLEDIADRLDAGEYDKIPPGTGVSFLQALVVAGVFDPQDALADYEAVQDRLEERTGNGEET